MTANNRTRRRPFTAASLLACASVAATIGAAEARFDYVATVDLVPSESGQSGDVARGRVFEDVNRDGRRQDGEAGIAGVMVSNGREVVLSDSDGRYRLPVEDDMTVMISTPAGWATPMTADGVPQFFYIHKPDGTPEQLRYGGLAPTGPLPGEINFPLVRQQTGDDFSCVAMGDTQPYSNSEVGYLRDGVVDSLLSRELRAPSCLLLLGDVMGDDLGLLPRFMDVMSVLGLPQYYIHGNHDFDFDASSDAHSADSWRQLYGPNYYSFEIGQVFFIALDNVIYPCTARDAAEDDRAACGDATAEPTYNGRLDDRQMIWLRNSLALVPDDKLVVIMHHIPFVSFIDSNTGKHQTDNVAEIYELLQGRPALSLSGHTHTYEYLAAGESFAGWQDKVGISSLPFDHVIGGAPSGNWFQGDFGFDGAPMAFARDGTPPGYMVIEFEGNRYRVNFHAANQPPGRQMALSFNTPQFRAWFETLWNWQDEQGAGVDALPPVTVNDLDDLKLFTPADLAAGVYLTANVWNGERNTQVFAEINGGERRAMTRTQAGDGEDVLAGADYADPFAIPRQMTIGRYAWQSRSGNARAQGFESWQGRRFGPAPPQSSFASLVADSSSHLWRLEMPENLPSGTHVAKVTAIDRHGRQTVDRIVFEVRDERPPRFWRSELWETE